MLPPDVTARVAVDAASGLGWAKYAGPRGAILTMQSFGASAPLQQLLQRYGFTAEDVVAAAKAQIARVRGVPNSVSEAEFDAPRR